MWDGLLVGQLRRGLGAGRLHLTLPDGRQESFGSGAAPEVWVKLHDPDLPRRIVLNPEVALGEAYVAGTLTITDDDLAGLVTLALRGGQGARWSVMDALMRWHKAMMRFSDWNPVPRARRNVAHHYDLSAELYDLFLDENKQYTCAYFRDPGMTLDQAQIAKMAHIGRKLLIAPGMRVLDIGSGFGTLAITLARDWGARVTGVTLSQVQLTEARLRAEAAGVADRVEFRLQDYREVAENFDRVVSVGMMEHVGRPHLATYFSKVADLLSPEGVALIHYVGRPHGPEVNSPWIEKYIFPGTYCPALSDVMPALEKSHLYLTDLEVWRGHYDQTLAAWLAKVDANADRLTALYDDRFLRMWRYYLVSARISFSEGQLTIHQMQLAKAQNAVPASRNYLYP